MGRDALHGTGVSAKALTPVDTGVDMATIQVDVVSAEEQMCSGRAKLVALPGEAGELGIWPGHTPLVTRIRRGAVRIERENGEQEFVFVANRILEIQPGVVTVLP